MRYSRRLGERSQSAHRRHLEELSILYIIYLGESLPRENRRISYVENKTVKQHSINPLDRDVLSLIESRLSTDNPNLISVLDINNQIHEAEEEEEEYLPPDTIWEDELDNGVYETEEMGHGVLDVNIPPEFEQHSRIYIYIYICIYIMYYSPKLSAKNSCIQTSSGITRRIRAKEDRQIQRSIFESVFRYSY